MFIVKIYFSVKISTLFESWTQRLTQSEWTFHDLSLVYVSLTPILLSVIHIRMNWFKSSSLSVEWKVNRCRHKNQINLQWQRLQMIMIAMMTSAYLAWGQPAPTHRSLLKDLSFTIAANANRCEWNTGIFSGLNYSRMTKRRKRPEKCKTTTRNEELRQQQRHTSPTSRDKNSQAPDLRRKPRRL